MSHCAIVLKQPAFFGSPEHLKFLRYEVYVEYSIAIKSYMAVLHTGPNTNFFEVFSGENEKHGVKVKHTGTSLQGKININQTILISIILFNFFNCAN